MNPEHQSQHFKNIRRFMKGCNQTAPDVPTMPSPEDIKLRVKLILEEAFEYAHAAGVDILTDCETRGVDFEDLSFEARRPPNLTEMIDAHADISVVNTGGLVMLGVADLPILNEVDANNLLKLEKGTIREDGKLIKPPNHPKPDFSFVGPFVARG